MPSARATTEGVAEAWTYWLNQHPISVPELIERAVEKAVDVWMDANADKLITAIAEAIAKRSED